MGTKVEAALAAVYAAPDLDAPRAVLGDFLLEQGQPLGEFIQLQLTRAAGKRRIALARERELFELHKKEFWPDHPVGIADSDLSLDDVERGFPWRFNNPRSLSAAALARLPRHPGWATIRSFHGCIGQSLDELLPLAMPHLRELHYVSLDELTPVRDRPWQVEELTILSDLPVWGPTPALTGFRTVRALEVQTHGDVATALGNLEPTGLLAHVGKLYLRSTAVSVAAMLDALPRLQPQVTQFWSRGWLYPLVALTREGKRVHAKIVVDASGNEEMLGQLRLLRRSQLSSLKYVLATKGAFTRETRALAEKASRKMLNRFNRSTLSSKHPVAPKA